MAKALAMVSGGLDSILAAKLVANQGIEVIGVCFKSYFFGPENAIRMTKQINLPLEVVDFSKVHFEMVKNPKHGYGKNINPCIDCHAMMMRYTGELMEKHRADFIITGEVLNQRPMSQNKSALNVVKKESGYSDKILRPLSAKLLPPTEMELNGLVDREQLLDIAGRSRKPQMELAELWGIVDYPSPAGGCKLTEPNYSVRLKDLLKYNTNPEERELELLKIGRHFRITESAKIISTRTEEEGKALKQLLKQEDLVFLAKDFNGSLVVVVGEAEEKDIKLACKVTARYCKGKDEEKLTVRYGNYKSQCDKYEEVYLSDAGDINNYLVS